MSKIKVMILIGLLAMSLLRVKAQQGDSLFIRFETRFELLDSIIHHPEVTLPSREMSDYTNNEVYTYLGCGAADSVIERKVAAQINAMKSVTGLSVNGQIYGRLDEGFGLNEDDALSRYKGKIQADVRWNFLNSSLINRKGKSNEIRIKGDIERLEYRREDLGRFVTIQKEQFRIRYDSLLCGVLSHRIVNLLLLSDAQSYLLSQGGISSDDLLDILNEKAEAERIMATITRSYPPAADLSNPVGVIVRVDTMRLMEFIHAYNTNTSTIELRRQLLDQQVANTHYWNTLNLSPFVRYSYYMRPDLSNSSNVDVGVSFIIPLSSETAKKRKTFGAERDVLDLEKDRLDKLIVDKVRLALLDLERMNRSIVGEVKRLSELKKYLNIRRKAYNNRIGEYNYLSRMKEYNMYLLCCERLLAFGYQRDCILASLQMYLPDVSILEFCVETEIQVDNINPV